MRRIVTMVRWTWWDWSLILIGLLLPSVPSGTLNPTQSINPSICLKLRIKAKFHYAILVADRSEAGRRPAAIAGIWHMAIAAS